MLTVKDSFFWNGHLYVAGQEVKSSDAVVAGRRHLFNGNDIEQASAAPGATRSVKRPASKPTKPTAARKEK